MQDDEFYTNECVHGNTEAFGTLYDRYAEKIYRFVYYKTFSKELAEDIVSEVFVKALEKISSFDAGKGSFPTWLYRIARNAVIDHYRTRKALVPIDDVFDVAFDERTVEQLDALRSLARVQEFLESLNPKQREIIVLRIWEELSYREIAAIVGGTEDGVKMAFSRGIREVREKCGLLGVALLYALSASAALPFSKLS